MLLLGVLVGYVIMWEVPKLGVHCSVSKQNGGHFGSLMNMNNLMMNNDMDATVYNKHLYA